MDAREQLFHAAFTPPELFIWIAHVCLMHNLTASIDGSFKNTPILSETTSVCAMWSPPDRTGMRDCAVHECTFVNRSGHPVSSVFFIEISVVFQKQVLKNKCSNVVPRCWCAQQMVPISRRIHSSPLYLLFSPTGGLFSAFYRSLSFHWDRQTNPSLHFVSVLQVTKTMKRQLKCAHDLPSPERPNMFSCTFF